MVNEVPQNIIHQNLKNCWFISGPEQHHQILKVDQVSIESGLPLISFLYSYQVKRIPEVELGKDGGTMQKLKSG